MMQKLSTFITKNCEINISIYRSKPINVPTGRNKLLSIHTYFDG
jgi:hypothetical protein